MSLLPPHAPGVWLLILPAGKHSLVGQALRRDRHGQLDHPRFWPLLVQPLQGDQGFKPAALAPVEQGAVGQMAFQIFHGPINGLRRPVVSAALTIDHQCFANDEHRPHVIGCAFLLGAGAEPAVRLLRVHNRLHVFLRPGDQRFVPQKIGQRHEAVQPVGHPFPALGLAADPRGIPNIGPNFIQMAGQPLRLNFQLTFQPTFRAEIFRLHKTVYRRINLFHGFRPSFCNE